MRFLHTIPLILLVVFSTLKVSVNAHFCQSELVNISLFEEENCCSEKKMECCDDEKITIENDEDLNTNNSLTPDIVAFEESQNLHFEVNENYSSLHTFTNSSYRGPPDQTSYPKPFIRFQKLILYA